MTDSQNFRDFKIKVLPREEISLAVDAYGRMLDEIREFDSPILNTKKTTDFVYDLLQYQYMRGNVCYGAYCPYDAFPVGYSLVFENLSVDLEYRIFNGLGLFIEPEYRKVGLGTKMIEFTLNDLKEKGVKRFVANFTERKSSSKIIKDFEFELINGNVCKNFY